MRLPRNALIDGVRTVLADKMFTETQILKVIPRLNENYFKQPECLAEIIDRWNMIMGCSAATPFHTDDRNHTPPTATAPKGSLLGNSPINMNTILADVEPDLLLMDPDKLMTRHNNIQGLGIANNLGEQWIILFNAPRGFYLQDWIELTKKIYYIEQNLIDLLYDKKEQKTMEVHPIVKAAASVEVDFDQIRVRHMFASRCGYRPLAHLYEVQTALDKPSLKDILLSSNDEYLERFTPFCTIHELTSFARLIKEHDLDDQDDAEIFESLAELNAMGREK